MSSYSYSEIQSMQKKALERVRQMQKSSEKFLEETEEKTPYIKPKEFFEESSAQVKPKITNMPPNFPQEKVYPDFKEFFQREEKKTEKAKPIKNTINTNILDEPDKAIILGLIMLLKSEGADEMLIMALMYILS